MKKIQLVFILLLLFSCQTEIQPLVNFSNSQAQPKKPSDLLIGDWHLDSSAFIRDNELQEFNQPILPTSWSFTADGKYSVKNSMFINGLYEHTKDAIIINIMNLESNYAIVLLNKEHLQVKNIVYAIDTDTLKSIAYLTRM